MQPAAPAQAPPPQAKTAPEAPPHHSAGTPAPEPPLTALPPGIFPSNPSKYRFNPEEDAAIDEIQQATFSFFWEEMHARTGLVKDRSQADGPDARNVASIAATGFALTALCIADRRGWRPGSDIRERVRTSLRFALNKAPNEHGFLYHFMKVDTGERVLQSEVSPIDTAIFLCGVLTCRAYFEDAEIRDLATKLYERVDWPWMLHGEKTFALGWRPERGFLKTHWDSYSEMMMLYLLALGSPSHPVAPDTWTSWVRPHFEFNDIHYIGAHAPLFVHQYSHAWFDFRSRHDRYADYFVNSIIATKVHKEWCLELARQFPNYAADFWGISASDSAHGYTAWGGPPPMGPIDGSIVPCATAGSLPFLPAETFAVLANIRAKYGDRAWRKYGFVDAFNPLTNWYSPDVVGIDAGITILMSENARTGFVWEQFMKNPEAQKSMERAGFQADSMASAARPSSAAEKTAQASARATSKPVSF